ncbi:hypothetical protein A2110_01705 [Candidatus Jorgensenbacteria bacterium GWA1_54_12]|uniref:PEGA domain-containing protein n=1 Tax=Candidatus Jorgensenbacteria bacterium GWA1_54_12 TaxID=1798468 RepID=A0A1F6BKH5_9BACT|nr:MAG: hypothetical protein A2110_01705 [Candidatus Jorgensenbacteria bacterium GWA1_54_12]
MATKKRRLLTTLAATTAVLAFLIISAASVVWANGLRYNTATGAFERTVLVAVDGSPQYVDVLLNGTKLTNHIPYRVRNLLPGHYTVELEKPGFQTWTQSFWLSVGQVGLIKDPTLIASKPLITTSSSPLGGNNLEKLDFGLELSGGELTDSGELITRYSRDPFQIHRFNQYYLYQVGSELRLYLTNGSQDYLIYTAQDSKKLPLALYPSTWQVAVEDGSAVKMIDLTTPTP